MRELDGIGHHGSAYPNNFSQQENASFTTEFTALTEAFKQAQLAGAAATDESVQDLVRQHYEFCLKFWTPNREAYKALAQSYLFPTPYRDTYEAANPGLAKFHHDAIVVWADSNLE